jgi:sulfur-oxidizing protein SoxX
MAGSERSRQKFSAEGFPIAPLAAVLLFAASVGKALIAGESLTPYEIAGDTIPKSLTGTAGDPARGRAILVNRQLGLCLLCHSGPFPEERLQGSLAPSLAGVGSRYSVGQLRLRIVDASRTNPQTIMPPYYRAEGLVRVAPAFAGKSILNADQIEDVVAFLSTLKEE